MERDGNDRAATRAWSSSAEPSFLRSQNLSMKSYVTLNTIGDCCSEAGLILTVFIVASASGGLTAFYAESKLHKATNFFGYTHKDAFKTSSIFFIITSLLVCALLLLCFRNSARSRKRFTNFSISSHTTVSA